MDIYGFAAIFGLCALFTFATFLAKYLVKARHKHTFAGFAFVWAAFTAVMYFAMENATGWDGLGYMIALIGLSAPIGAGLLVGGLVGLTRREPNTHA